jgi:hypothetical protein
MCHEVAPSVQGRNPHVVTPPALSTGAAQRYSSAGLLLALLSFILPLVVRLTACR